METGGIRAHPRAVVLALAMLALAAAGGFLIGRAVGAEDEREDAKAEASRQQQEVERAAEAAGYRRGLKVGKARGLKAGGRPEPRRAEREAPAAGATTATPTTTTPGTSTSGKPRVEPGCPAGQEPTAAGGCKPYDERDGQIEPKISDPRCYEPRPPAACF